MCAALVAFIFDTDLPAAFIVDVCLTPTDPVLAASTLSSSQFSNRVHKCIKDMLAADSVCNDGISFGFLCLGLFALTQSTAGAVAQRCVLITLLWLVTVGTCLRFIIGTIFNRILRICDIQACIDRAGLAVSYTLGVLLRVGVRVHGATRHGRFSRSLWRRLRLCSRQLVP